MQSTADFPTSRGLQLMQTMAKHFGHKIPVEIEGERALMRFDAGEALAELVPDGLRLSVTSDGAEGVVQLRDVIERHLLRFAQRDDPQPLDWTAPA